MKTLLHFSENKFKPFFVFVFLMISLVTYSQTTITSGSTVQASAIPSGNTVTINAGGTLNMDVSRSFTSILTANSGTSNITGSGTLTTGILNLGSLNGGNSHTLSIASATTVICTSISNTNGGNANKLINLSGTIKNSGTTAITTLTCNSGSTFEYNGAAQTVFATTYHNLTLSGSGSKVLSTTRIVNGTLSIEGTATASAAPTYGSSATLQYNTTTARTILGTADNGIEWITPFAATGGVVVANTGKITLGIARTISSGSKITINNLATLDPGGFVHVISGGASLVVDGTLDLSNATGEIRSGTSGTSTLTMGTTGFIRTIDTNGLGPASAASFSVQTGGAWDVSSLSTNGTVEYYRASSGSSVITDRDYNNLIISGTPNTKTWTMAANRTVSGDLTISTSATFTLANTQTLFVKGNWSNSATFNAGTSTVTFNGTTAQSVSGATTFNNLSVTNTSNALTLSAVITVSNNLSLASGTSLNLGTLSHTANSLTINGFGTASGTWGSTSSSPLATNTNDTFFAATTGKVTVATNTCAAITATISGTATICAGASSNLSVAITGGNTPFSVVYVGGIGGTVNNYSSGSNIAVTPSSTSTYTLTSVTDQNRCPAGTLSGSATVTVNTLSTDPTSATASSSTICNGTSTVLTLNGGGTGTGATVKWYTGSCGGSLVGAGNGLLVSPSTTTTYYGRYEGTCNTTACVTVTITVNTTNTWLGTTSSAWNDASNWSCGVPDANTNISIATSSPNAPILNVDFTLVSGKTLTISGTGSLTIASQSNFTIAGTADFGGKSVTIKSDSNGTGAIGEISGSLSNATNVTVERYIPQGKRAFRFLTPGVTTTNYISGSWQQATHITGSTTGANGFDQTVSGSPSMYTYNNTVASGTGWTAIANTNATNLESGLGYRILIRGDRTPSLLTNASAANMNTAITLSATGTIKTGQVVLNSSSTPAINNTSNTTTNGFSLVGNPYVSPVDWHAVTRSGLLDTYYAWDANMGTSSQRGRYVAYSVATGYNSMGNSGSSQVGRYIQPGQAFFVRNTTLGTAGTLTFDESDKADTYTSVFRNQQSTDAVFSKLGLLVYEPNELALGSAPIDGAVAFFGSDFTNAIDSGDVEKLESAGENLAWLNSGQKSAMSTMAPVSNNDELLLKTLRFAANKSYTFKFEPIDFDSNVTATLVDQFLNTQTAIDLTQDVFVNFTTTTDVLSFGEDRFKIVFNVGQLGNSNFESVVSLHPNPSNGNLFYLNLPTWDDTTKVAMYNTLGQQIPVSMESMDGMTREFSVLSNLSSGVYYIKITQNGKEATKKWILNN